ncbi:hypothetical protein [Phormidium sp. CCY1219]|jgi:hypothetical protein|uniref:hypothetical protein n=1 Tax=Phormidium sp. CCY1219 TaxID=2886104 RepID=UPI002D1F47C5|nr:hypothetical protein [Phormidium sp. CCY1219]MEB3826823.1 hypothetical protein [Phormidium sp. CCY1219]
MQLQTLYPESNIAEVFGQAWNVGVLSRRDRQTLMSALLENSLNPEEHDAVDRLFHAVRRGWIQTVE